MCLRLCWTAAVAATVLTGAAFADVTVSQSNDPTSMIEGEFASLFGAEHKAVAALPAPRLQALAIGPQAATATPDAPGEPGRPATRTAAKTVVPPAAAAPAEAEARVAAARPAAEAAAPVDVVDLSARADDPAAADDTAPRRQRRGQITPAPQPTLIRYDLDWLASQPAPQGDAEWQCLRTAIYFEARGETVRGQFAVAEVVLNRVDSPHYPRSICGVVQQSCQFSYTCDGAPDAMTDQAAADVAGRIARVMIDGAPRALTMGATHFHTRSVRPEWAGRFPQTAAIGAHLFYRQP